MRIEFDRVEQKMEDLRGYYKGWMDPDKNPYRASELTDDEFNFISGMNYALSYLTDSFLGNLDMADEIQQLAKLKEAIAYKTISDFSEWGYCELENMMTGFIDGHEDE